MTDAGHARQSGWKDQAPSTRAWKGRAGRGRDALAAEQDRAAGGRQGRYVPLSEERYALASVELKVLPRTRRIRAYLRWSDKGRTSVRYLGQVDKDTRAANLIAGWEIAKAKELVGPRPAPDSSWASSDAVRSVMRGNRGRDTKPELRLRSLIHRQGLRYRVGVRPLPELRRTADLVFTRARVAVFVDGCFWHGCPAHLRPASRNSEFWREKIEANRARDEETDRILTEAGWKVVRVWEHEDLGEAALRVAEFVREAS
ncbi:very short patch repair endonuclease [Marinitenerispora sediminis]|uniref:Very short patch repair endonuclease n=1 Tax=Marinitenerispora sediminis TaxID=1931232 RepID=A0A368T4S8_9ACTN|nr:very short patch repair endonuclease [Marinitenerispora sediminis]RCV51407.1 very short patch repair endonuclease [Marinitenerispora sediminis]RCV57221.1 very short patch repair endonuclease [Marinitenerispora sediminis]RCV58575.1 very short patch repair endonuclease [Marinitenerispora sediminis]